MEKLILTNMCMVHDLKTDSVLVIDRKKGSWTGFAFPGGHVETGESIVDSVIREIKEETGLTISDVRLCGVKDWFMPKEGIREIVMLFTTNTFSGTLMEECDEGNVQWVEREKLWDLPLAEGFGNTARVMMQERLAEQFFHINDAGEWIEHLK